MKLDSQTLPVETPVPVRVDRWIRKNFPALTQPLIEKAVRKGAIRVNGDRTRSNVRVVAGDAITLPHHLVQLEPQPRRSVREKPALEPLSDTKRQQLESWILWEDENLLVLNKPFSLATQGGTKITEHVDGLLQQYGLSTGYTYRLVHRLDRDTTGVLMVAKTEVMLHHLMTLFREGAVRKTYWALCVGRPPAGEGTMDAPILKDRTQALEKMVIDQKNGKKATTFYRLKETLGRDLSWVSFHPQTGRTHQIRVHAAALGCPILGDGKYGGSRVTALSRQMALHAHILEMPDLEGKRFRFTAPPPEHFMSWFRKFNISVN